VSSDRCRPLRPSQDFSFTKSGQDPVLWRDPVLLYTATPGADGTLGGLAACAARTGALVRRAVTLAKLCSNDPICAHHAPDEAHSDRPLHGAACHGCVFIAETSCEQRNDLLDRSLITDTLECAGAGFFPVTGVTS